ncbi:MAG: hypothetical protein GAK33_03409 [Burkholderia lata]|uniref:Uncharacterized protein n=1 Tax=Burkholderia lata (strain ATCC 17760 / DSM 23089 / LMG 22485 / NCIMB 9086 / R18194 / 383) TaxID=482957 RepID=A0A833PTQ8_BURL3|nr:MAG: hypothetical protein GAK33_03409 [Burkholderia lata]
MRHNRGLALIVEIHSVESGLIGRTRTPEPACCAIAGVHPPLKHTGSRARLSAGHTRQNPHAAQSRAGAHRGNTQGFECLQRRLSTPDPAMPTGQADTLTVENHSPSSDSGRRISTWMSIRGAISDPRPGTSNRPASHAGSGSSADRHSPSPSKCTVRRLFRRPDIHKEVRVVPVRMLAREPEIHDTSDGTGGRMMASWRTDRRSRVHAHPCIAQRFEPLANAAMRSEICTLQTTRPRSPLKCTALRGATGTRYPFHGARVIPPRMRAFG